MGLENFQGELIEKAETPPVNMLFRVEPEWIDSYGHVNNEAIDGLFLDAQIDFASKFPAFVEAEPGDEAGEADIRNYLRRKSVDYFKELKMGDSGNVVTRVEYGGTSIRFIQQIYNQRRELAAEAVYIVVPVDQKGKKRRIAKEFKKAIIEKGQSHLEE